jgi:hypothetical protein
MHLFGHRAWCGIILLSHACPCRALLLLPLHLEYLDSEMLQPPSFDATRAAADPMHSKMPLDTQPGKAAQKLPWGILVCHGKDKDGMGFSAHDMALLREWGRVFRVPLCTAGLLQPR